MWTSWHSASTVVQQTFDQIDYTDGRGQLDTVNHLITVGPALGNYSSALERLITEEPNSLLYSGFRFNITGTVQGVELLLVTQRLGRIQDRVIQLHYQQPIGDNRAMDLAEDRQIYGSDLWGVAAPVDWTSDQFGVVIDLQPHRNYPSNNPVIIHTVNLRLFVV